MRFFTSARQRRTINIDGLHLKETDKANENDILVGVSSTLSIEAELAELFPKYDLYVFAFLP